VAKTTGKEAAEVSEERNGVRGFFRNTASFLLGGIVGASAAVAARRRGRRRRIPDGLTAFEDAPCHREASERRR
jgi:hypothetical protein